MHHCFLLLSKINKKRNEINQTCRRYRWGRILSGRPVCRPLHILNVFLGSCQRGKGAAVIGLPSPELGSLPFFKPKRKNPKFIALPRWKRTSPRDFQTSLVG